MKKFKLLTPVMYVASVNFAHEWLQFNVDSEQQIYQFYLLSEFLPEICREAVAEVIFQSYISYHQSYLFS